MADTLYYTTHDAAIGRLLLVASERGLRYLTLLGDEADPLSRLEAQFSDRHLLQVDGFFTGTLAAIDAYLDTGAPLKLPFDLAEGTALQRAVWLEIARIPYGETISYTMLAERVGFPRAVRAVASACGANPLPLVIPCHRVLAKDGSLGGFSLGGLGTKEFLLSVEARKPLTAAA